MEVDDGVAEAALVSPPQQRSQDHHRPRHCQDHAEDHVGCSSHLVRDARPYSAWAPRNLDTRGVTRLGSRPRDAPRRPERRLRLQSPRSDSSCAASLRSGSIRRSMSGCQCLAPAAHGRRPVCARCARTGRPPNATGRAIAVGSEIDERRPGPRHTGSTRSTCPEIGEERSGEEGVKGRRPGSAARSAPGGLDPSTRPGGRGATAEPGFASLADGSPPSAGTSTPRRPVFRTRRCHRTPARNLVDPETLGPVLEPGARRTSGTPEAPGRSRRRAVSPAASPTRGRPEEGHPVVCRFPSRRWRGRGVWQPEETGPDRPGRSRPANGARTSPAG